MVDDSHGCILCAEVNTGFDYLNEELDIKICKCSKGGKVLFLQEAFDYIKHLQRIANENELEELATLEEDLRELDLDEERYDLEEEWLDEDG